LREILELDPLRDAQRIVYLDLAYEFPFDTTRSLELALFRTFGSPAVSKLLDASGEFAQRAQRRYDDTDLILSTIAESGYDSELGKRAIRRMNRRTAASRSRTTTSSTSSRRSSSSRSAGTGASAGGGLSSRSASRRSTSGAR
jgi:hypothetical protein